MAKRAKKIEAPQAGETKTDAPKHEAKHETKPHTDAGKEVTAQTEPQSPSMEKGGAQSGQPSPERLAKMQAAVAAEDDKHKSPSMRKVPPPPHQPEPTLAECNRRFFAEEKARAAEAHDISEVVKAAAVGAVQGRRTQKNLRPQ